MNLHTADLLLNLDNVYAAVEDMSAADEGRTAFTLLVSGDLSESARDIMSRYHSPGTWLSFIICPQWKQRWALIGGEHIAIYTHA